MSKQSASYFPLRHYVYYVSATLSEGHYKTEFLIHSRIIIKPEQMNHDCIIEMLAFYSVVWFRY